MSAHLSPVALVAHREQRLADLNATRRQLQDELGEVMADIAACEDSLDEARDALARNVVNGVAI